MFAKLAEKRRIEMEAIGIKTRSGSSNSQKRIVKSECIHKKRRSWAFHLLNRNVQTSSIDIQRASVHHIEAKANATYLSLCALAAASAAVPAVAATVVSANSVLINSTIYTSKLEYFMVDVFRLCHCQCDAIFEMLKFVCWTMDTLYAFHCNFVCLS